MNKYILYFISFLIGYIMNIMIYNILYITKDTGINFSHLQKNIKNTNNSLNKLHNSLLTIKKNRKISILNDKYFKEILRIDTNQNDYSNIIDCYTNIDKFIQTTPNIKLLEENKKENESILDVLNHAKDDKREYDWSKPHTLGNILHDGSTKVLKHIYDLILSAEKTITITTLLNDSISITYMVDKLFLDIIKNALAKNNNNLNIRILSGYPEFIDQNKIETKTLHDLYSVESKTIEYMNPTNHTITCAVHCATKSFGDSDMIWNHSKIIMIDGSSFLIGGENLWEEPYISKNYSTNIGPISDTNVSFFTNDSSYIINFCSTLFKESIYKYFGKPKIIKNNKMNTLKIDDINDFTKNEYDISIIKKYENSIFKGNKTYFKGIFTFKYLRTKNDIKYIDADEMSRLLSFSELAKETIYIAQQKLTNEHLINKWEIGLFESFAKALNKGVIIKCIISNNNSKDYSSNFTIDHIRKNLINNGCNKENVNNFNLKYFSYGNKVISGQHTKMWCIDEELLSIGSHNIYYSPLDQCSIIISNKQLIQNYLNNDFHTKWNYSIPA